MNKTKHTIEPWRTTGATIRAVMDHKCNNHGTHRIDTVIAYLHINSDRAANAKRIVDCVNACAGVADPINYIPSIIRSNENLMRKQAIIERQRDELLSALKVAQIFCNSLTPDECPDTVAIKINEAIANAKGGAS